MASTTLEVLPIYQEMLKQLRPLDHTDFVFVYGTLKSGQGNNRVLGASELLGDASVIGALFDYGPYPVYAPAGDDIVWGEVYRVDSETLERLDHLEGEGYLYKRMITEAIVVASDKPCRVWIYRGHSDWWHKAKRIVYPVRWPKEAADAK